MKKLVVLLVLATLAAGPIAAGVVYEIEVTDHSASPPRVEETSVTAEGKNLKIGIAPAQRGDRGEMIFRSDRREMVVIDHKEKTYSVIDEETMKRLAGQLSGVMDQLQEALKNVPEDQRAMVEKMMKEKMPAGAAPPARPETELRKTGERADKNGYPCVKYEVYRGGRKIREMWVTNWDNVEGGSEVVGAFEDMADFFKKMMDAIPDFGQGPAGDTVFEHMKELDGFPVVTRELGDDGSLEEDSSLRSARRRTLDPAEFEPPAGYKRRSMWGE